MHELSLALAVLEQALKIAAENRMARIEEVVLDVGGMQLVAPDALEMAFSVAAQGTPAEGARLVQRVVAARATCRRCGNTYQPAVDDFLCPRCGAADAEVTAGREIILSSLSGPEQSEDAS